MSLKDIWYLKYRPTSLDKFIFSTEEQKNQILNFVEQKSFPHVLLSGAPGCGKTTLASLLISSCIPVDSISVDVLKINASENNSVDFIRTTVLSHITSMGIGDYKVVWLEEADYLSFNAQAILRDYMEQYQDNCRFIMTCNNKQRLMAAIISRTTQFDMTPCNKSSVREMIAEILVKESIKTNLKTLDEHINSKYPDIRGIINSIEQCSIDGRLSSPTSNNVVTSEIDTIIDLVKNDKFDELIKLSKTIQDINDIENFYVILYENIHLSKKFSDPCLWMEAIINISDHLSKHNTHPKPVINLCALTIQLNTIGQK